MVGDGSRVVALTGARTFLGRSLIRLLDSDPTYRKILALDLEAPAVGADKLSFHKIDLTVPEARSEIAALLTEHDVDTVVHAAFLNFPTHAASWAHELEDVGTMHVLDACAQAKPRRLILASTTLVYGAHPHNPNYLTEDSPLSLASSSGFVADKVRADEQTGLFAAEHPRIATVRLRFAPIVGPTARNFFTRYFARPIAPTLVGYDPLVQLIHERDAVRALKNAVDCENPVTGPINIVGRGVIRYRTALAMMGKLPLPMPHAVASACSRFLWAAQLSSAPPAMANYLRYMCVADGTRAVQELGFRARHDQRQIILDYIDMGDSELAEFARAHG
jgi:UDP-glucose 4-epimerase